MFNGVNVAKHWHGRGEVFSISDCLVQFVFTHVSPVITNFAYFFVYSRLIEHSMTCSLAKLYGRCLCIDCL